MIITWTYPIDTKNNIYPNLTVHQILKDGVHDGWRVLADDGYVMYDTAANDTALKFDEATGEMVEVPTIYYSIRVDLPVNFNFANFTWAAELRSNVPELA